VVVYGSTPAGIAAATAAGQLGLKVALYEPLSMIGGMGAAGALGLHDGAGIGGGLVRSLPLLAEYVLSADHGEPGLVPCMRAHRLLLSFIKGACSHLCPAPPAKLGHTNAHLRTPSCTPLLLHVVLSYAVSFHCSLLCTTRRLCGKSSTQSSTT
jgi:hypothetical protein